jgi:Spy/CpxP family protein refolding chaperone
MKTRLTLLALLPLLLLPGWAQAQQSAPDPARRAAMEARRDSLEAAIMARFLDQLGRDLSLEPDQRTQLERALREGALRRRELMRSTGELRGRIHRAVRSSATTDAEFARLLADHESLRQREAEIWRREQEELSRFLTARQRVQFVMHWVRFQDEVRDIIMQQMRGSRGGGSRP